MNKNSKASNVTRIGGGAVLSAAFQLDGQDFFAMNKLDVNGLQAAAEGR